MSLYPISLACSLDRRCTSRLAALGAGLALLSLLLSPSPLPAASGPPTAAVGVVLHDEKSAPVASAVAYLTRLDAPPPPFSAPLRPLIISLRGEEFSPAVVPMLVGTQVTFENPGRFAQSLSLRSTAAPAAVSEHRVPAGTTGAPLRLDQPGVITLGSNINDWMSGHLVVLATPYFAQSAKNGTAILEHLPPGRYRLEIWHPRLAAPHSSEVTLAVGEDLTRTLVLALKPDRRLRRAPNPSAGDGHK